MCLRLVVQTLVLKPGDMMCLRLVVHLVVTIPFESLCLQLLTADCDDITADVIIADPSTDSADVTAADISDVIFSLALQLVLIVPAGPAYLSSWIIFSLAFITAAPTASS
ncbi:hypothetical protein F511_44851 [Dorcoceras hygrometricum]|uniref:Uncharacterized protein n=1 Tax=Dorcoceras hygrometricum TaxID=472368 RepID=A0A2Z7BPK9_9LAMI|nr:hypothetical protein F511_44851 [Dorcoceras hygrometricum]